MLVEREDVLAELLGLAADGFDGHGRLAFLGGEAGVGKTSVVRALAEQVADRCLVRIGVVDNLTTADALAAFVDALPGLEFAEDARKDVRLRSLRDQLRHRPMLLVLEDLHWADQASLDALLFLGRRLEGLPVLIVASYRHDEVSPRHRLTRLLGGLVGLPEVRRIVLPPLSPDGVRILVDRSRATLDVDALHARTGGNPFFVTEVLAGGAETVPDSVRDAVMARFAGVSTAATEVAAAAATLGVPVPLRLLAAVSGRPAAAVDECLRNGLLVTAGAEIGFRHELARQAVEQSLPAAARRRLHRRALDELTALSPLDHRTLAHHALGAGAAERAVTHAEAAGRRAASLGAHREAVTHFQLALRAAPSGYLSVADRARLFEQLSYECYLTDQIPEAIAARQRTLELRELEGDVLRVGDTQRWLSRLSWFLARNSDAERYGVRAVATLEPLGDSHELAMAYANLTQLRMLAGDLPGTESWAGRALRLAERLADREVQLHTLNSLGSALTGGGRYAEGKAMLERSLDMASADDAHEHVARAYTNLGSQAAATSRCREAERYLAIGVAYCEERDLDSWTRYMQAWQVVVGEQRSAWDDVVVLAERLLANPELAPVAAIPAASSLARIQARRGLDAGASLATASGLAGTTGELQRIGAAALAAAEVAWIEGRLDEIGPLLSRTEELLTRTPEPWKEGEVRWWRLLAGLETTASAELAEPFALMLSGRLAEASAHWEELSCPSWQTYCDGLAPDVARAQAAIGRLTRLGAGAAIEAIIRTRRTWGLALPRRPRAAARARPGQLTEREQDVLVLLPKACRRLTSPSAWCFRHGRSSTT